MLAALIGVTAAVAIGLIAYAAYWLITDARERRWQAERADAFLKAHREAIARDRYHWDEHGRPE